MTAHTVSTQCNNVIFTINGITVTVAMTDDEENLTKALQVITVPKVTPETDPTDPNYGPSTSKLLDILMKAEQRITIDGYLTTGVRTVAEGDSHESAEDKKADLKKIFLAGKAFNMTYEGSTFKVNSDKLSIKRINTSGLKAADGEVQFSVKMTVVRGEDMI